MTARAPSGNVTSLAIGTSSDAEREQEIRDWRYRGGRPTRQEADDLLALLNQARRELDATKLSLRLAETERDALRLSLHEALDRIGERTRS